MPPVQTSPIHNDPAILQSCYSSMSPASTHGSGTISGQSSQAIQLGYAISTFHGGLPLHQAAKNIESLGSTPAVANCSGFGIPMYGQGFCAPTSGLSHLPQAPLLSAPLGSSIPHYLPQHAQFSSVNSLFSSGTLSLHEATSSPQPIVSCASTSVQHPNVNSLFATTPSLPQCFSSLTLPASCTPSLFSFSLPPTVSHTHASLLAAEPSLNLLPNRSLVHSNLSSVFGLNVPLVSPLGGYINTPVTSVPENNASIRSSPSIPSIPFQMFSQSMPSSISSFSSIQGETSLPLVTLGQLQHPSYSKLLSSLPLLTIHEDAKFKAPEIKIKSESEPFMSELSPPATSMMEPLLPLPVHPRYSMLPSSLPVQTIHEEEKFTAEEPKIMSESEPLTYELTPQATSMMEPLLTLPKHLSYSPLPSSLPVHEDVKFKAHGPKIKSGSEPLRYEMAPSTGSMLGPLLPLPNLAHRWPNEAASYAYYHSSRRHGRGRGHTFPRPVTRYSEEFDFMAMNEKFNKAEVWDHLSKGKALSEYDERGQSRHENAVQEENEESPTLETQPAYSKDDFFDKISYKATEPDRHGGRDRALEQFKVELETSGDFPRDRSSRGGGEEFPDHNDGH